MTPSEASGGEPKPKPKPKAPARPKKLLMKQPQMMRMIYPLLLVLATGIWLFGWRVLALTAFCGAVGFGVEYLTSRQRNQPVSTACFVTILLYAMSLPPLTPFWVAGVGMVVAILFGKEVYGGFGRNWVNPAIVGRAFVYICFPIDLTKRFVPAFRGFPGGFANWSFERLNQLPDYIAHGTVDGQSVGSLRTVSDAITQASPMWVSREYGADFAYQAKHGAGLLDMIQGTIGGFYAPPDQANPKILAAGSIGEGCAVLILAIAVYLLVSKTAKWQLMLSGFVGLIFANTLFRNVLGYAGVGQVPPVQWNLFAGTTIYAVVFMVTEPVSAPKKNLAMLTYGFLIGLFIVFLRWQGVFVAAATFSILLGNMLAPLLDLGAEWWEARRKPVAATAEASA
jgi:Na+-transporting NADH:ubiquinone oxidoreductase subunit B